MQAAAQDSSLIQRINQQRGAMPVELYDFPSLSSMIVCHDGPKLLVSPTGKGMLRCYTEQQWIEKLWAGIRLSPFHYPIIAFNILIFLFGTTGNVFVCLSVRRNQQLRNVTNYFIVNLAVADFLVILICLPATALWDLYLSWFFGTIPCKLIMFLQDVSISVSVLTLTAISIDRYYAICHPLKFKSSLNQAKKIIALIWVVSLIMMSPDLLYLRAFSSHDLESAGISTVLYSDCDYDWDKQSSRVFQFVKTILLYLLPSLLMFCAHYKILQALRLASLMALEELKMLPSFEANGSGATANNPTRGYIRNSIYLLRRHHNASRSLDLKPTVVTTPAARPTKGDANMATNSGKFDGLSCDDLRKSRCSSISCAEAAGKSGNQLPVNCVASLPGSSPDGERLGSAARSSAGGNTTTTSANNFTRQVRFEEKARSQKLLTDFSGVGPETMFGIGELSKSHSRPVSPPTESPSKANSAVAAEIECSVGSAASSAPADLHIPDLVTHSAPTTGRTCAGSRPVNKLIHLNQHSHSFNGVDTSLEVEQQTYVNPSTSSSATNQTNFVLTMHNKNRIESRRRAAKMLSAIVVLFGLCYLPVHLINFLRQFIEDIPQNDATSTISMLAHCVCYLNSAINPIIYNHMNSVFREEFKRFLCLIPRHKTHLSTLALKAANHHSSLQCPNHSDSFLLPARCNSERRKSAMRGDMIELNSERSSVSAPTRFPNSMRRQGDLSGARPVASDSPTIAAPRKADSVHSTRGARQPRILHAFDQRQVR